MHATWRSVYICRLALPEKEGYGTSESDTLSRRTIGTEAVVERPTAVAEICTWVHRGGGG